ncbi:MAG TPA: glycosyltransferase family 4 protein, partial [Opitutus sp.]|nr:glycosyltransferase family 4 protein [Opitutus sp.]
MNLLFYAPQMAPFGGMERHVCNLAGVLSTRGHHVVLLTTSNSLAPQLRQQLATNGVTLRELPVRRGAAGKLRKGIWLLREAARTERVHWDLIYTSGQSGLAPVAWLAGRPQTRIVHHHHTAGDRLEQATWSGVFRHVLQRAPEIVACSRATQHELARALRRSDVRFLPYLTSPAIDASAVRDRTRSPNMRLHFGFLGRLVPEKGIDQICALSRRPDLADISWHLHGEGSRYPAAHFQPYPNIAFHGPFVDGAGHAEILQRLDALVLFSTHNEGMPLSLIEAMAAGLPWIASDRGGTRELAVSPANAIVVGDPANLDQLAAAVRRLAGNIRDGRTSRLVQRRAYDWLFSPPAVAEAWCS